MIPMVEFMNEWVPLLAFLEYDLPVSTDLQINKTSLRYSTDSTRVSS